MLRSERGVRYAGIGLGLALASGLCTSTLAQPPVMGSGGGYGNAAAVFDTMDRDGNGTVSAEEHAQFRAERLAVRSAQGRLLRNAGNAPSFQALDADGNGTLTRSEVMSAQQARMAARGPGYGPGRGYTRGSRPCLRGWQGN